MSELMLEEEDYDETVILASTTIIFSIG